MRNCFFAAIAFAGILACASTSAQEKSAWDPCDVNVNEVKTQSCLADQSKSSDADLLAAQKRAKNRIESWSVDKDGREASLKKLTESVSAFEIARNKQCGAFSALADDSDGPLGMALKNGCLAKWNQAFSSQIESLTAPLPQRSWFSKHQDNDAYAEVVLDGQGIPRCAKAADNKLNRQRVLMSCFEQASTDSGASSAKAFSEDFLPTLSLWKKDDAQKMVVKGLFSLSEKSSASFRSAVSEWASSLVPDYSDPVTQMSKWASEWQWSEFYKDQIQLAKGLIKG